MSQEQPDDSASDPYAGELTVTEVIEEWAANVDGRYVLISSGGATEGRAVIYDTKSRMVGGIDEGDDLHRQVVNRMLHAGVKVFASYKEADAAARPAT